MGSVCGCVGRRHDSYATLAALARATHRRQRRLCDGVSTAGMCLSWNIRSRACLTDILPKTFYDIPVNDPLTQTMSHFAGMNESINDALGNANCLGSGYIMRRTALQAIGGFPTESLSEDACCSATLLGAGWKTAFIPEAVQYGSVPDSYLGHIKQRTRWVSQGSLSSAHMVIALATRRGVAKLLNESYTDHRASSG